MKSVIQRKLISQKKLITQGLLLALIGFVFNHAAAKNYAELPVAISNNAVAAVKLDRGWLLFSFNGLTQNKNWQAVTNLVMEFNLTKNQAFKITNVPYSDGRLASIAVTVKQKIYLFGGYTVSKNHEEKSTNEVYQFDPSTQNFSLFSTMPIPVDDTVALVYKNRYIYLISGWHDTGNISNVQILDTQSKKWFEGNKFPGKPVFGHAAGIVDNKLVVVDGVKVDSIINGKRQYKISAASYLGEIDPQDFTKINWQQLPNHPYKAKYRMAAVGVKNKHKIIFAGGSDNPYNFNGIGYNGIPSEPSDQVFAWDLQTKRWQELNPLKVASMDHRGLLKVDDSLFIIGGMLSDQTITNKITKYKIGD